jgi:hypothetical protein
MVVCCHSSPFLSLDNFLTKCCTLEAIGLLLRYSLDLRQWYMSKFSSPKEREKGYHLFFFKDLSQLSTRGRNPTMLFYSFMPITAKDWMDGWMDGWMNDSLKILECRYLLWWPHGSRGFYNQGSWRIHVPSSHI